jgi:hypothetical protein
MVAAAAAANPAAAAAFEFGEASDMQLEEMEALEVGPVKRSIRV